MALSAKKPTQRADQAAKKLMAELSGTGKKKRLNAEVDETLYGQIKMSAAQDGRSISDITRDLWVEYLSK